MSERDGYQHGVPCWIDTWQPDAEAGAAFYSRLFGWETEDTTPPESDTTYVMCRLRGRDVAAIGSPLPEGATPPAVWGTNVWVRSADAAAAQAREAGGSVVVEPFGSLDGGRMAVLADPAGAAFGVWEPGAHKGAQVVNEPGAWSMSLLHTSDPEGAKAFYGAVLGWETDTFDMGGNEMTLWRVPGYRCRARWSA
jgi:predicted enzyme related to lactoylglutathione lyase